MKITDLTAALTTLDTSVNNIKTAVDSLKATLSNVDLPADAQAALDKLTSDVATLAADVPSATPPTA